ncbi:hypothetical protein J6590_084371 [Homalodisca vitripennis]|nr:hypothetical protein J6590_084371 [Homalodisca vitripennis]
MTNPKAPTLKGQPKTHIPDIPIRPVVNFRNSPTYKARVPSTKIAAKRKKNSKENYNWFMKNP